MSKQEPKRRLPNAIVKYSGLSFQIAISILAGVYGGKYLDERWQLESPVFTLIGSILGLVLAMYIVIKETRSS